MSLRRNLISNFILTGSSILLPLVTFPYITRTLSSSGLGQVFFIDAFTQYFVVFSAIGIPYYGVREIARLKGNPTGINTIVSQLITLHFSLAVVYSFVFLSLSIFVPGLNAASGLVKVGCLTVIANAFVIEWFYQGMEYFTYITVRSLIIKLISVVALLFFVRERGDHLIYYLTISLAVVCSALLNFSYFVRKFSLGFKFDFRFLRHIKPLLVLFSIHVSISVYTILDTIILGFLSNEESVSFYNVPLKLVKVFWTVMAGVGTVFIPRISDMVQQNDRQGINKMMTNSLNIVLLLSMPFCFFCLVFPTEILFLVAGGQYTSSENGLRVLSIVPMIIGICNVFGTQYLLPVGKEKKILHATFAGLIVSLAANFIMIPFLGYLGAAIACVLSETAVCVFIFRSAYKETKVNLDLYLIYNILAGLIVSFISFLVLKNYLGSTILMIVCCVCYLVSFLLFHILVFKNKFIGSLLNLKKFFCN